MEKFSVLMSVYINDKSEFLEDALDSILVNQTLKPAEVILVEDGPLTEELDNVINIFKKRFPEIIKIVKLKENKGLGNALNIGLSHCNFEIVARMDSDDISWNKRFETQMMYLKNNENIDVVGGAIAEFYNTPDKIIAKRMVPKNQKNILDMMKRRNPMNHVSVMFRKDAVIKSGGYKHLLYLEDYYLWIRMVENGCHMANIEDILVYVRTGNEMYKRRGNKKYIRGWYKIQGKMKNMGIINYLDLILNMWLIIIFIYIPPKIKEIVYRKFLRI